MRRHPPHLIKLTDQDRCQLQRLLRDGHTQQRVARRARILLAREHRETIVQELAEHVALTPTAIWWVCRRYEERGLSAIYDAARCGRGWTISPSAARANRTVGLL
jgi:hypothetical protein